MLKYNKKIIFSVVAVVLFVVIVVFFVERHREKKEIAEIVDYEKQQIEREYSDLASQPESSTMTIGNDSLLSLVDKERTRIQQLLNEMKVLKSTNIHGMNKLRKELEEGRQVMRHYVFQIDSLNSLNQKLTSENKEFRKRNHEFEETLSQMSKEKESLTEKINKAAILETAEITVQGLNMLGRKTNIVKRIVNLQTCFRITKNKNASVGQKKVYLCIIPPNGDILRRDSLALFAYEKKQIPFSCEKEIEYQGEDMDVCLYWKVSQALAEGKYRVDIFADGSLIGETEVVLGK
jgi:hypothetical protein